MPSFSIELNEIRYLVKNWGLSAALQWRFMPERAEKARERIEIRIQFRLVLAVAQAPPQHAFSTL